MKRITILLREVKQLRPEEINDLPRGSVILVRSDYAYEKYKDHPALIVGGTIKKPRGVRPNLITFPRETVANISALLNEFDPIDGKVILLLNSNATEYFMQSLGIHLSSGEVIEVVAFEKLVNILNG